MVSKVHYYRHSGSFRLVDAVLMLGLGGIFSLLIGGLYGLLVFYMPFIKLTFLITGVTGFLMAMGLGILGHVLKIRNVLILGVIGVLCWFFAWYASWVTWSVAANAYAEWMLSPSVIWAYASHLVKEGAWSLWRDDFPVRGYLLMAFWVAEAAILLGIILYLGVANVSEFIFCEPCDDWLEKEITFAPREVVTDSTALVHGLEVGDYDRLLALSPRLGEVPDFTEIVVRYCAHCDQSCYLTLNDVTEKPGKREVERKVRPLFEHLWVSSELVAVLKARWPVKKGADEASGG